MSEELTRELAEKLIKFEGKIRGVDIKADAEFVKKRKGEEGLKQVRLELEKIGFPIDYEALNSMESYPGGLKVLSLLAIQKVFGFDQTEMEEVGRLAPKVSFFIKPFMRFAGFFKKGFFRELPRIWRRYWTKGDFIPVELSEEKKYALIQIRNLTLHPVYCAYMRGYFTTFAQMAMGVKGVSCEELKCPFRGDEFHELIVKWK